MLTPVKVEGFSGGITDNPVGSSQNQFQYADNLIVAKTQQLYTRPGSVPFSVAFTQLPTGNQRVGSVWNFNEDIALVGQSARRCFYFSAGWNELLGPTNNVLFSAGTTANRVSGADWKGHLLLTNDGGALPMKVFQDQSGAYKALTLGLPKFLPANAYAATTTVTAAIRDLANNIRTQMLAHFANTNYATAHANPDTGGGSSTAIITAPALILGDTFATAQTLVKQLSAAYANHHADAVAAKTLRAYHPQTYVNAGAPNIGLSFIDAPTTWLALAQQVNEIKRNFNWHVSSFKGHVDTGGPHNPPLVNDRATTADLASTAQGPTFSDVNYSTLITFANGLKATYNAHLADTTFSHPITAATRDQSIDFTGQTDVENKVQMIDATDANSLFELAVHQYCAYRDHQADAVLPVYGFNGKTYTASLKKIDTITPLAAPVMGQMSNIAVGMFVQTNGAGGAFSGHNFPLGTKVATVSTGTQTVTTDTNNSLDGTDATAVLTYFSYMKYHLWAQQRFDPAATANGQKGNLVTFDAGFDVAINSPGTLSAMVADIAAKFNLHDANFGLTTQTGVHPLFGGQHQIDPATFPTVQGFSYGYAFLYRHKYQTLSGETFVVRGTPYFKTKASYYSVVDNATAIPDLASFNNLASSLGINNYNVGAANINNYDTANTVVEVYRTIDGGQVYFYAGSAPLGTAAFKDSISDAEIISQEKIYTNGGVLSNDPPPVCKFMHVTQDGTPYFGGTTNILDDLTAETIPQRIQQGGVDAPDSAPESIFIDLPAAVTGISSVRTIPIAFTKNATYRLEGKFDEQGQGSIVPITISDRVGLVGSFSPVQVDGAVVFAGPDQFYMTDGYSMLPLGRAWPTTYANIVSGTRAYNLQGVFDKKSNRAWWGATGAGVENDRCFILDLNFPAEPNGCWTTASNGVYFAPTALCLFNGQIIRGDSRGYVFVHDEAYRSDPRLDTTGSNTAATTWFTRWIPYKYTGPALDFGLSAFRKWSSLVETKFDNFGDLSLQLTGINDMGRTSGDCFPIRSRSWTAEINERRYFPSGSLYFALKQLQMTNAKVVISNSDTLATATVTLGTTVTLAAGAFPADMVDHVIAFAVDGYVAEYTITNETVGNTVLTVAGAPNGAGQKWVIRGYPKTEKMQLQEYTLWATPMGVNQTTALGETGANA